MSKRRNYIKQDDRYNYWPDRQRVLIWAFVGAGYSSAFNFLKWKTKKDGLQTTQSTLRSGRKLQFSKTDKGIWIKLMDHYNFNDEIRQWLKFKLKVKKLEPVSFPAGDNFVPIEFLDKMAKLGLTRAKVRAVCEEIFWKHILNTHSEITLFIKDFLGIKLENWDLKFSQALWQIEICRDIRTAPYEELALNKVIHEQFKRAGINWQEQEYNEDGIPVHTGLIKTKNIGGRNQRFGIIGEYVDGSIEKLYFKCSCKRGALNRTERVFKGKDMIKKVSGRSHTFDSLEDYREIVNRLIEVTFQGHLKIYNIPEPIGEKKKYKKLKGFCSEIFKGSGEEVFQNLKNDGMISTKKADSKSCRAIVRKAPSLASQGILLRAVKRGVYEVDWNWVLGGYENTEW